MLLTNQEINNRLIELRNLRRLYEAQKIQNTNLRAENQVLKARVKELESIIAEQTVTLTDLKLQMEELRTIVFGKKKQIKPDDELPGSGPLVSTPRSKESYQRPVPKEADITHHVHHNVPDGHTITKTKERTYYVEDIPDPQKTVTKHTVIQGYCTSCRRWVGNHSLPTATVVLGIKVKRYIVYLSLIGRLSYAQIRELLLITYDLRVSDGEITRILKQESIQAQPNYEQLKVSIRSEPSVHLDETGWSLQQSDGYRNYSWAMVGGVSGDAVYTLGKTRGKGNALDLLGDTTAVVVSDDYGAYRNLEQPHQLCCAHILRKLRDLATSTTITDYVHIHCRSHYQTFATIYSDIKNAGDYRDVLTRLQAFVLPNTLDPTKLARIKTQVKNQLTNYLTCLLYPSVAPDNNPAERALRHVVLKRKISFGSFSQETAERTAILLSVLMTYRHRGTLREWVWGGRV